MSLELSGTTPAIKGVAGSVSAPALTGDDVDTGISFPSANTIKFSTGGVERMSITNSGVTGAGGKFASYAVIADQKAAGTAGGTSSTGSFVTRDLNTILTDPDTIVSVSSNQFTLQAGTYLISASAPSYKGARHQILIYNVTDSTVMAVGTSEYTASNVSVSTRAFAQNKTTISGAKVFEVRHRVASAYATYGFGVEANMGQPEIYTMVEIFKES